MRRVATRELAVRTASAAVMVPLVLIPAWTGNWPLAILLVAAGWQIGHEWFRMLGCRGLEAYGPPLSATAIGGAAYYAAGPVGAVAAAFVGAAVARICIRWPDRTWSNGLLGVPILAFPLTLVWELRGDGDEGRNLLLWCLLVVWTTDTFAYLCGRVLRGRRLAPTISPGKTWSGLFGGIFAAGVAGGLVGIMLGFPAETAVISAVSVGMATIVGDLVMSAVKRAHGCKDTGRLIPGHGGVLDRVDGFLFGVTLVAIWKLVVKGT
ncbi:MAG: phosphatidate cytidylyltransferase [Rhodospirillales bacterium]|nr:phosphatidate cytidylyltransferase [Rhodospirillales bacterium]